MPKDKRRRITDAGYIGPTPVRPGGRAGGRQGIFPEPSGGDSSYAGSISTDGGRDTYNPSYQPTEKPFGKAVLEVTGEALGKGMKSGLDAAKKEATDYAVRKGSDAIKGAAQNVKDRFTKTQPQPQAGGGNPNKGGTNMRGRGNGNGGSYKGGGSGSAFEPGTNWNSGNMSGPYAAAPSGPRVFVNTPHDGTLNKIASVPQQFYKPGANGKFANQQVRTQVNAISWDSAYFFNIKDSNDDPVVDTVNTVISNVWDRKVTAIQQGAIAFKRGSNPDIRDVLTLEKLSTYHNVAIRGHAMVAEINARRNFLPEYEDQNQALSLLKDRLNADTELLTMVENLKYKLSNLCLSPKAMEYCCWMYQLNKNIPEPGSDVSLAMSSYMLADLDPAVTDLGFPTIKSAITTLLNQLNLTGTNPQPAAEVNNLQYQIITSYLKNTGMNYQLMGNHVFGHPKMDYDPVWNGMWDNMALYVNDATSGRVCPFGEYDTSTDMLQVAFPMPPQNVPIASSAPLIMNFGEYGSNNTLNVKRSAFPYWGLSSSGLYTTPEYKMFNKFTLELTKNGVNKGFAMRPTQGSRSLLTSHIFNYGASINTTFEFVNQSNDPDTGNYLKQRGENIYQYSPAIQGTQDAVKRLFVQMECAEAIIPLNLRD